jgi:predicted DNA-binding transcriptional regulator AlpA
MSEKIKYSSAEQEADRLGVPLSWIYSRVRQQGAEKIPHRKAGKYLRFISSEVDQWLEDRTAE